MSSVVVLPGAVGAEQGDDLAGVDVEVEVADDGHLPVAGRQAHGLDQALAASVTVVAQARRPCLGLDVAAVGRRSTSASASLALVRAEVGGPHAAVVADLVGRARWRSPGRSRCTTIRSQVDITRPTSCSTSSTPMLRSSASRRMRRASSRLSFSSRPAAGSSSMTTDGPGGHGPGDADQAAPAVGQLLGRLVEVRLELELADGGDRRRA